MNQIKDELLDKDHNDGNHAPDNHYNNNNSYKILKMVIINIRMMIMSLINMMIGMIMWEMMMILLNSINNIKSKIMKIG